MKKKILLFSICVIASIAIFGLLIYFECSDIAWACAAAGFFLPIFGNKAIEEFNALLDVQDWQASLRKQIKAGIIKKTDIMRISFAYLFRIKINGKYLLILNHRKFGKYQPVGGVYKCEEDEKLYLKGKRYFACDDNCIPIDESSKNDYRMRLPVRKLRAFVRRFNKTPKRELISDISREFYEELVAPGILDAKVFGKIKYRVCGRHFNPIAYSKHFKCYELIMADIVEFLPTEDQEKLLTQMLDQTSTHYKWATEDEILSCGVDSSRSEYVETITEHSYKILDTVTQTLVLTKETDKVYEVKVSKK